MDDLNALHLALNKIIQLQEEEFYIKSLHPIIMVFALQDGQSPLHMASSNRHVEVVKILIEAEADVNLPNKVDTYIFTLSLPCSFMCRIT